MENLKVRDLVKEDIFSLSDVEKVIVIKEYMRRFGIISNRATCPINFNTGEIRNNIGIDEDVIKLIRTLDNTELSEGYDALWYQPYLYGVTMYTLKLKKLIEMNLSSELVMYVVNSFYRDTLQFRPVMQEQVVLMFELIASLPEEMQLEAFRVFRNGQIYCGFDGNPDSYYLETNPDYSRNLHHKRNFRLPSAKVNSCVKRLHNALTLDEIVEGIETRYGIPQKMSYAVELVNNILDSKKNATIVTGVCEKYRSIDLMKKADLFSSRDTKMLITSYLDLVMLDPNPEYSWIKKITDVKRFSDEKPYCLKYAYFEDLNYKILLPLRTELIVRGMSVEQANETIDLLKEQICDPSVSVDFESLGLVKYLGTDTDDIGSDGKAVVLQKI